LRFLEELRFTGDVWAVPEGTPVFGNEPLVEVEARIAEAQLVEAFTMNQIHLQTVLASNAVRVVEAAQGRPVVDFGLRRMHGVDAGLKAARAFHIAGVHATSNLAAGQSYGVHVAGTLAHSYIQAHDDEREAFGAFARAERRRILPAAVQSPGDGCLPASRRAGRLGQGAPAWAVRREDSGVHRRARVHDA
jgi:nicotinate phosphoribosyltransferase